MQWIHMKLKIGWLVCKGYGFVDQSENLGQNELTVKNGRCPCLDCLSYWFCPNCFSLLIVLVILSNLHWEWWIGIPINNIKEFIHYQLEVQVRGHKITVEVHLGSCIAVRIIKPCILNSIIEKRWKLINKYQCGHLLVCCSPGLIVFIDNWF